MKHFGIGDVVLACTFVQEIKEPLDGRRQILVYCQNGTEKVDDKFLDGSLGR